jgi:hypothetical protein
MCTSIQYIFAISAAERSAVDYSYTLTIIRELQIMVDNFGTDEQKKKFDEIKLAFRRSSEKHYAQEFQRPPVLTEDAQPDNNAQYSTEMFMHLKIKIIELFDEVGKNYISRSKQILDSTSTQSNDVLINYGKNTGLYKYFFRAIDPVFEKKPYKPENYHYYRDKETIERYLKNGYKSLHDAESLSTNPDFIYLLGKKNKTPIEIDSILTTYAGVIKNCRQAKQYGLEIHKLLNLSALGEIQRKHGVNLGTIRNNPLYDDRIPEDYKVDSIDNLKLNFTVEKARIGYKAPASSQQKEQPSAK